MKYMNIYSPLPKKQKQQIIMRVGFQAEFVLVEIW